MTGGCHRSATRDCAAYRGWRCADPRLPAGTPPACGRLVMHPAIAIVSQPGERL